MALIGVLLFSTLLISVFNNLFDNIVEMVRTGHRRYALKNHILFLGAGKELIPVLKKHYASGDSRDIAIMTSGDIETLRSQLELKLEDNSFVKRLYLYQGDRDVRADLESACAGKASLIYIFGESGEQAHDSRSLACYDILKLICKEDGVSALGIAGIFCAGGDTKFGLLCDVAFFFLLFGMYYILEISTL